VTGWQVLPVDSPDFEGDALRPCELILAKDPRIGKVPKRRVKRGKKTAKFLKAGRDNVVRSVPRPGVQDLWRSSQSTSEDPCIKGT
jgi:hypothetical protein